MEQSTEADRSWPDHQQYPKLCRRPLTSSRCKNLRNKIILQAGYTAAHLCTEGSSGILYIHVYLQSSKYSMMPLDLLSRISELALKTLSNGPGLLNSPLWVFCFVLFLYFNASIFKGKWDFCLLFLYLFIYLFLSNLAYSSKPRDQSTLLSWSLSPSLMCDYWNSGGERCSSV